MRYVMLGVAAVVLSAAASASANAQEAYIDINGPKVQHGMCLQSGIQDGYGLLVPCPGSRPAVSPRRARASSRPTAAASEGGGAGGE